MLVISLDIMTTPDSLIETGNDTWTAKTRYLKIEFNAFSASQLSVCKLSLHYPHKISCLVMRIKEMIIHSNLSKMKNKILQTCLQETIETV